ncbi:MAG: hypothetical protein IJB91_03710 [Oscillospiraceae bacterium]|nr:hypothetical protein [Oscillospiraceae bacterium]
MPKHSPSKKAICPFYRANQRQEIFCEGIKECTRLHLGFADPASLEDYRKQYCESYEYGDCRIAKMLAERFEEEVKDGQVSESV